jgi:hypothetical protein
VSVLKLHQKQSGRSWKRSHVPCNACMSDSERVLHCSHPAAASDAPVTPTTIMPAAT